jgi:hypothetical protein
MTHHHTLTFNWSTKGLQPDKPVLQVETGDTISFQLGTAPPGSTFRITAKDREFFSPPEVTDSSTKVKVVEAVKSSFRCELFDAGGNPLSREGDPGTQVEPGGPKARTA